MDVPEAGTTPTPRGIRPEATRGSSLPRVIASLGALGFLATGVGAMAMPARFYEAAATFAPYNQHFIQDIGAFNLGLGVVLLLATRPGADALRGSLVGALVGSIAHVLSHVVRHDLGGTPWVDIPVFTVLSLLLGAGAWVRHRELGT